MIDVPPRQVWWLGEGRPKRLIAPCPHRCNHVTTSVLAWGPTNAMYVYTCCYACRCEGWDTAWGVRSFHVVEDLL